MNQLLPSVGYGSLIKNPSRLVGGRLSSFDDPLSSLGSVAASRSAHARVDVSAAEPTPEARMVAHMKAAGVKIYTMEGCGWCTKMKQQGHGIEDLVQVSKGGEVLSNKETVRAYPTTDFGNGSVALGFNTIASKDGSTSLYDLFLQSMTSQMKAAGVKIYTMDGCTFCNLLKAEGSGIESLFVASGGGGGLVGGGQTPQGPVLLSDNSQLAGFPTTDFGNGVVIKGFLPLSASNVNAGDASKQFYPKDGKGLYERFIATVTSQTTVTTP
jgi:hypothetical protein